MSEHFPKILTSEEEATTFLSALWWVGGGRVESGEKLSPFWWVGGGWRVVRGCVHCDGEEVGGWGSCGWRVERSCRAESTGWRLPAWGSGEFL